MGKHETIVITFYNFWAGGGGGGGEIFKQY